MLTATSHEPFDTSFDWRQATRSHTIHGSTIPETCPVHGNPWIDPIPVSGGNPIQLKHYTCGCEWCVDMPYFESGMFYFFWIGNLGANVKFRSQMEGLLSRALNGEYGLLPEYEKLQAEYDRSCAEGWKDPENNLRRQLQALQARCRLADLRG